MDATRPCDGATPDTILHLAKEYRAAAHCLLEHGRNGQTLSRVPCRFIAIHAIELYLSAFLLARGIDRKALRRMQHDLAKRAQQAVSLGLVLRKRTDAHLATLTDSREYIVSRYDPEKAATLSQINRLMATLDELAKKAEPIILAAEPRPG